MDVLLRDLHQHFDYYFVFGVCLLFGVAVELVECFEQLVGKVETGVIIDLL